MRRKNELGNFFELCGVFIMFRERKRELEADRKTGVRGSKGGWEVFGEVSGPDQRGLEEKRPNLLYARRPYAKERHREGKIGSRAGLNRKKCNSFL